MARCVERGAQTITVLPGMLMAAGHAKNDIPSEIHEARRRYPDVQFHYGRHLHLHSKIIDLCRHPPGRSGTSAQTGDRARHSAAGRRPGQQRSGRQRRRRKLARMLCGRHGLRLGGRLLHRRDDAAVARGAGTLPPPGLRRVLVFPFFLFTGVLEKRIRQQTLEFAQTIRRPSSFAHRTSTLIRCFWRSSRNVREEAIHGSPYMNCELCKYRVQLPGFADASASRRLGHHHHVRGIGQERRPPPSAMATGTIAPASSPLTGERGDAGCSGHFVRRRTRPGRSGLAHPQGGACAEPGGCDFSSGRQEEPGPASPAASWNNCNCPAISSGRSPCACRVNARKTESSIVMPRTSSPSSSRWQVSRLDQRR